LFDLLTLTINSGQTGRSDRIAKNMYYRQGEEPTDGAPDEDEQQDRMRRGLAILESLRQCNLFWLPHDMFQWDILRFDPDTLLLTAYSNTYLEQQLNRSPRAQLEKAFRAIVDRSVRELAAMDFSNGLAYRSPDCMRLSTVLWSLCYFRYCNWLLRQMQGTHKRHGYVRLPAIMADNVTSEERLGARGLSYGLIDRCTGHTPDIGHCRGSGGNASRTGFSAQPNDWDTRVGLLFTWNDNFLRTNWDHAVWRTWTRHIFARLTASIGKKFASWWLKRIGRKAAPFIQILPRYEKDKMYQSLKRPTNISEKLHEARSAAGYCIKWIAAQPVFWIR
ncbi:hypothetical protein LTR95_019659, partial [Oleoguttula sp. CCFEE 5521]